VKTAPGSCIYHHTHRFLQQHQYLSPEPPNDFAHWVADSLGEPELGERLASIDTVQFSTIRGLRTAIAETVEQYLKEEPSAGRRFAAEGEEFHLMKSVSFAIPTKYAVYDLMEFADALAEVTIHSIYFHMFEARLRLERPTNDFSLWIKDCLGDQALARQIDRLDPYTRTLENLRKTLIALVTKRMG
ncbi:MAG: DUF5752 family protein, partial [bacterium]